jgi:hypothetical protein
MRGTEMTAYAQELRMIAAEADRREEALNRLAFCFDTYLTFTRDGREPTKYADGSIAMDAERAIDQLEEAIAAAIGLPTEQQRRAA